MKTQLCLLLAASVLASRVCAANAIAAKPYLVLAHKHGEPRRVLASSTVHPWMSYEELSAQEKGSVRAAFPNLGANDEPPYPRSGTHAIIRAAQREVGPADAPGVMHVVAHVDEHGVVGRVEVRQAPHPRLGERLAAILKSAAFKPARCKGVPCAMEYPLAIAIEP